MKDTDGEFREIFKGVVGAIIILSLMVMFFTCSGCRLFKSVEKSSKDSTSVKDSVEGSIKSDSSGTKTENTKETVYYPQPIYIQGKDGETKTVFVPQYIKETGKTEQAQVIRDTSWKEAFEKLEVKIDDKEKNSKTKIGPSLIEWILIVGVGLLLLKNLPFKIIKT